MLLVIEFVFVSENFDSLDQKTDQALYSLRIEQFNIFRLHFQIWQNDRGYFAFFNDKSWLLHTEIN